MTDIHLSTVRQVTMYFVSGGWTSYLMAQSDVDVFIEASKRLHWRPGRNPHNGVEAAKIWRISVAEFVITGPFWWSTPDLQNNHDPRGASIIQWGPERYAWTDEEYLARLNPEEED